MKKSLFICLVLAIASCCFSVASKSSLQERIRVVLSGKSPVIQDFVRAYLMARSRGDFGKSALREMNRGTHDAANTRTTVDSRNGFFSFEQLDGRDGSKQRIEVCYWNCDNKREKLVAVNHIHTLGSMSECELTFYRYSTRTGAMSEIRLPFDRVPQPADLLNRSKASKKVVEKVTSARNEDANAFMPCYSLPQNGKNIVFRFSDPEAVPHNAQREGYMKWNGNGFNLSF